MGEDEEGAVSLARLVRDATAALAAAGIPPDEVRRDATVLARWCLGWNEATWLAHSLDAPPAGFAAGFADAIARRAQREPVSHITGQREFYGRAFVVTSDVLTPRPESEFIVEEAVASMRATRVSDRPLRLADVGTGSGCLAITLALEVTGLAVVATDVSAAALGVAQRNARRLAADRAIHFARMDLLTGLNQTFDVVVANPPYVADPALDLPPEVRREPAAALFAGPDGLDVIRRLVPQAAAALVPDGHLIMEIGWDQDAAAARLVGAEPGLELVRIARDLQSHPRVVVARRVEHL